MDDKTEFEKWFERVGDHYLHPSSHGEKIWPVTIEEMYQHFKARMLSEVREARHKSLPPHGSEGGRGGSETLGGLRWSEEMGAYVGPGGGAEGVVPPSGGGGKRIQDIVVGSDDYSSDSCGGVGIGNKVIE